ncbi:MAG TPA: MFS transporter [bacterium]|nr:MFS transporter [bacterium]
MSDAPHARNRFAAVELLMVLGFLMSLHETLFTPVNGEYLRGIVVHDSSVALIEGVIKLAILIIDLFAVHIILRVGKVRLLTSLFALLGLVDLLFLLLPQSYIVMPNYFFYFASYSLGWICLTLLIKRYSRMEQIHTNEGKIYLGSNIGWLIGPALGGLITSSFGYNGLFAVMAGLATVSFLIMLQQRHAFDQTVPSRISGTIRLKEDLQTFFSLPEFKKRYLTNIALFSYYATMGIYFPIYLLHNGFSFSQVGLCVSIGILPFILLPLPLGKLADAAGKETVFFITGFLMISLSLGLLTVSQDFTWLVLFNLMGATGSALVESLNQSLFLKKVHNHKTAMQSIFQTSTTGGWVFSMILCAATLQIMPVRSLFLVFIPVMLVAASLQLARSRQHT